MSLISSFVDKVRRSPKSSGAIAPGADRMAERTIAFEHIAAQVVALVRAKLAETDPDNYHWMQDLYYDNGALFAVTVSAGRL